jgi:DNA-binding IclR family transcriptional regulator
MLKAPYFHPVGCPRKSTIRENVSPCGTPLCYNFSPMTTTSVKILDKTFRLLSMFSDARPEWRVTEMATTLGMPKSTVHRILRVLCGHEYLAQDQASGRFRLGVAALELGLRAQGGRELRHVAAPVLQRLAAVTGETVLVIVPNHARDRAVCIERAETRAGLKLILEVGRQVPLHAGASSKVILAYMTAEEIERVIAGGLSRLAPRTITSPLLLRRDLQRIRRRGWAYSVEETNAGAAGIAVPIFDRSGAIAAGLSVVGPMTRFTRGRLPRLIADARQGAETIAHEMGLHTRLPDRPAARAARRPRVTGPGPVASKNREPVKESTDTRILSTS